MSVEIIIDDRVIEISSIEKLFFPEEGITKGDLIDYYKRIADTLLPHLEERPLSLQRFPDGIDGEGFYQKQAPDYFPDWIDRVTVQVKEDEGHQSQVVCNNASTLIYLADQACITPHTWLSRQDKLTHPDKLIFDLDPPDDDFELVRAAARALRQMLADVGLIPFLTTTGSQGLHVVVPLDRSAEFDTVRAFARNLAEKLARREPDRFTVEPRRNKRAGRLFLDYLRNAYAQTSVAPYAVRPKPGAPIATPLDWDELDEPDLHPQQYTIQNIFRRLGQKDDPWQGMMEQARPLPEAQERLEAL